MLGEQVSYYVFPPKQNPTKGHKGIFGGDEHVSTLVTLMLSQVQSHKHKGVYTGWMQFCAYQTHLTSHWVNEKMNKNPNFH